MQHQVEFSAQLIQTAGVAVVPGCGFFHLQQECSSGRYAGNGSLSDIGADGPADIVDSNHRKTGAGRISADRYVRIAFCKEMATLRKARKAIHESAHILTSDGR